jgi:2-polyprenyl-3-methyl-5-hydroxy-6-metoxy-1,4-benzoquinol methylase
MSVTEKEIFETNQALWNKRTAIHLDSSFYNKTGFINGDTVLTEIELKELDNVQGKSLLHLQCHFGLDTLNWARLGATVTGVDLSDAAIAEANKINEQLQLNAQFICSNVYDLLENNLGLYDIVYTSYGTIGWLPDLDRWAKVIANHLKQGGIFYMADFHPVVWMFDDNFTQITYAYDNKEMIVMENAPTYTEGGETIINKEYGWNHSISEILNALLQNGLELQFFNEHDFSPYSCFSNTVALTPKRWYIKGLEKKIPMVYSLKARKR